MQNFSLLRRLETLGPGTAVAAERRNQTMQLAREWMLEERSTALAAGQGWNYLLGLQSWTNFATKREEVIPKTNNAVQIISLYSRYEKLKNHKNVHS